MPENPYEPPQEVGAPPKKPLDGRVIAGATALGSFIALQSSSYLQPPPSAFGPLGLGALLGLAIGFAIAYMIRGLARKSL